MSLGVTILTVAVVLILMVIFDPMLDDLRAPFFLSALAVVISTLLGGVGSGLLTTLGCGLITAFLEVDQVLSWTPVRRANLIDFVTFLIEGALFVLIIEKMRKARQTADHKSDELERINARLLTEAEERIKAQTELQGRESMLRLVTNALPLGIAYMNDAERYLFCNGIYANWHGRSRSQVIGETYREVVGSGFYASLQEELRRVKSGEAVELEREMSDQDTQRVVKIHKIPDMDAQGQVQGHVVLLADITHQINYQKELIRAKDSADQANRTKSAFLANMSHEIRTPLGAILGFSELLIGRGSTDLDRETWVAAIKRNGELLSNVINDILDLSKVEAGRLEFEKATIPLTAIVADLKSLLGLQAAEKGIKLSVLTLGPLPDFIETDPLRLRQILLNIVGNAIKFTERGFVSIAIGLSLIHDKTCLQFKITDSGCGIPRDKQSRLFEPFTQADPSTTRRFGGTGLGLLLSKRLAQGLGGDIQLASSEPDVGSTFVVTIDPGQASLENTSAPVRHAASPSSEAGEPVGGALSNLRVLLVEDSPDNQLLLSHILRAAGARVDTANNGREAIDQLQLSRYDVTLMDIQMPEMDGYQATAALRQSGYTGAIIALTAYAMSSERQRCMERGFTDYLCKPVNRKTLFESLVKHLPLH